MNILSLFRKKPPEKDPARDFFNYVPSKPSLTYKRYLEQGIQGVSGQRGVERLQGAVGIQGIPGPTFPKDRIEIH